MRHYHNRTGGTGQPAGPADRAAGDVAGMEWDELCELVGNSPAGDSPYAQEYFEAAAKEIVRRIDARDAAARVPTVPAGA